MKCDVIHTDEYVKRKKEEVNGVLCPRLWLSGNNKAGRKLALGECGTQELIMQRNLKLIVLFYKSMSLI